MRILGQPVRVRLVDLLEREGEMAVGALAEALGERVQSVSQHLAVLRSAAVVSGRHRGREVWVRAHESGCAMPRFDSGPRHPGGRSEPATSLAVPARIRFEPFREVPACGRRATERLWRGTSQNWGVRSGDSEHDFAPDMSSLDLSVGISSLGKREGLVDVDLQLALRIQLGELG